MIFIHANSLSIRLYRLYLLFRHVLQQRRPITQHAAILLIANLAHLINLILEILNIQ
jgi:hypothetical protein